jgi:hypothetical protein
MKTKSFYASSLSNYKIKEFFKSQGYMNSETQKFLMVSKLFAKNDYLFISFIMFYKLKDLLDRTNLVSGGLYFQIHRDEIVIMLTVKINMSLRNVYNQL